MGFYCVYHRRVPTARLARHPLLAHRAIYTTVRYVHAGGDAAPESSGPMRLMRVAHAKYTRLIISTLVLPQKIALLYFQV